MKRTQWAVVVGLMLVVLGSLMTLACSSRGPHNDVDQAAIEANIRSQIATHYPGETFATSANVWDSLADGFEATGAPAKAMEASRKALELLARDTATPQGRKEAIRQSAEGRLARLQASADAH